MTTPLAKARDILARFDDELSKMGFVGATDIPRLVFLAMYTRWLPRPVSVVVMGPTSSGKSFAVESALKLIPKEAFKKVTKMTPKALAYRGKYDLQNKFLYVGEQAGLAKGDGQVLLRQMLSEGQIIYERPVQMPGEGWVTKARTIEGPMGLLMTTTDKALHPEDQNRVIAYRLQGSSERIKEALKRMAKDSGLVTGQRQFDPSPWFELHGMVEKGSRQVHIPFAGLLAEKITATQDRTMRDFPKLLGLIKAHALLHQKSRDINTNGVNATLADYEAIRNLIEPSLVEDAVVSFAPKVRDVVAAVKVLANGKGVTQKDLATAMQEKQGGINRHVQRAIQLGFLKDLRKDARGGKASELILGDIAIPDKNTLLPDKVLPTVKELGR